MSDASLPIDTNVALPASVQRAAAAAVAAHQATYGGVEPAPEPANPGAEPAPEPVQATPQPEPAPAPPAPLPVELSKPEDRHGVDSTSWEGKYYAMEGRFRQSQVSMGQMQQQLAEMGDELGRMTQAMQNRPAQEQPQPQTKYVTDEDVKTYGPELLDTVRRAALEAVQPDLQRVSQQNQQTSQRVAQTQQATLYQRLDAECPEWRQINTNPRFKQWCNSPDVYSGQVRGRLLNAAVQAANAPRAIAFFKGFQNEEVATGNAPAPQAEPLPQAPRQAATTLDSLTAPGRAKPATGDSTVSSADKPIITRAQIKAFYNDSRRGVYAGREAEYKRYEQMLQSAQQEGRVRN